MINNNEVLPAWMTKCFVSKRSKCENKVGNIRPISRLPFMGKLLTGFISNNICNYLDDNEILPNKSKAPDVMAEVPTTI